jgi:hypothetical protein
MRTTKRKRQGEVAEGNEQGEEKEREREKERD